MQGELKFIKVKHLDWRTEGKKNRKPVRDLWVNIKWSNILVTVFTKRQEKGETFKEKINQNIPKWNLNPQIQEVQQTQRRTNTKKIIPGHIKIKVLKIKDPEKNLVSSGGGGGVGRTMRTTEWLLIRNNVSQKTIEWQPSQSIERVNLMF